MFEDGLAILKERERELRRFAKEKRNKQIERERQQLDAMEQVRDTYTNTQDPTLSLNTCSTTETSSPCWPSHLLEREREQLSETRLNIRYTTSLTCLPSTITQTTYSWLSSCVVS